jgi:putative redox protein
MSTELLVHAVNEGAMRIDAEAGGHTVTMDYPLEPGAVLAGFTPLQLLLASLAGCSGNTLALLLRRMKQPVRSIEVAVRGLRRDEHPTVITHIDIEFIVHGAGVEPATVARALTQSEEVLCPVWAMIKPATPITPSFRIVAD